MEITWWNVLILAVVQGITEFLPISSSGHLVIVETLLAGKGQEQAEPGDLNIVLHVGTLFSILVFYWRRVWDLVREDRRVLPLLIAATIPVGLIGVPLKIWGEFLLASPELAGAMLIVTGSLLIWASRRQRGKLGYQELTITQALLIGVAQAAAVLPGLSRSGSTISVGLSAGLSARSAATFSFLMAIPAIGGAGAYEVLKLLTKKPTATSSWELLALGAAASFVVGCGALWWLIRWLEKGRFHLFAWWCIPLGVIILVWRMIVYFSTTV